MHICKLRFIWLYPVCVCVCVWLMHANTYVITSAAIRMLCTSIHTYIYMGSPDVICFGYSTTCPYHVFGNVVWHNADHYIFVWNRIKYCYCTDVIQTQIFVCLYVYWKVARIRHSNIHINCAKHISCCNVIYLKYYSARTCCRWKGVYTNKEIFVLNWKLNCF